MQIYMFARSVVLGAAMCAWTASAASESGTLNHEGILDLLMPSHQKISDGRSAAVTITVLQSVGEDFRVGVSWVRDRSGLQTKVEAWGTGECVACALDRLGQRDRDSINALVSRLAKSVRSGVQMKQAPELIGWLRLAMQVHERSAKNVQGNVMAESRGAAVEITLDGSGYIVEFSGSQRYHRVVLPGPVLSLPKNAEMIEIVRVIERTLGRIGAEP